MKIKFLFLAMTALTISAEAIRSEAAVMPKPDLIMLQVEPNGTTVSAGAVLSVADTVKNQGTAPAKKFLVHYMLSADTTYGNKGDINITGYQRTGLNLADGNSNVSPFFFFPIPKNTLPGTYHVCAKVTSTPVESNPKNNTLCSSGTVTVPPPDLIISNLSTAITTAKIGNVIQVGLTVMNQGGSQSKASKVELHDSTNTVYGDGDDVPSPMKAGIPALYPGQSKTIARQAVKMPSTPGVYFICAKAGNNTACTATQIIVTATGTAANQWLLFADDGGSANNHLSVFRAADVPPIHTPIPALGAPVTFPQDLGEIHFANGKTFVVIYAGLGTQGDGGIAVFDTETQTFESSVILESKELKVDGSHAASRIVHNYIDPEGKFLWAMNDGPPNDPNPDSVFRMNVDPKSPGYLNHVEITLGNGHHKGAFSRPSAAQPNARKLFFTSDLTEGRLNAVDDDPASATYGQVIKIVHNVGSSPHGFDYSPASGRGFSGVTGGGLVSIDATRLGSGSTVDYPDVDCTGINDNYCVATGTSTPDPSVYKITTGPAENSGMFAGYVHVHRGATEDTVYTAGYSSTAHMGWLTAVDPGSGAVAPSPIVGIDLGDMSASNFAIGGTGANKAYVPASGNVGTSINNKLKVIDTATNLLLPDITVGPGAGENRDLRISPDGRLVLVPNTATNTVSVVDTNTDTVIDTLTLAGAPAKGLGVVHLPASNPENNH